MSLPVWRGMPSCTSPQQRIHLSGHCYCVDDYVLSIDQTCAAMSVAEPL